MSFLVKFTKSIVFFVRLPHKDLTNMNSSMHEILFKMYENATEVEKDERKAVEWYLKVAEKGKDKAQYNLRSCYNYGTGVEKDEQKAVEWYQKAAEQSDADAQDNLGWCFENGIGIDKDVQKA